MIKIYADVQPILRDLNKLKVKLTNQADALEEVGKYFQGRAEEGFRKEIDPYNKKWPVLSPATLNEKIRKGYPTAILTRTGKMRGGVQYVVKGKSVELSVPFPTEFHQRGTKKMPQRQILPEGRLSTRDERNVKDIFIDYLDI